MGKLEKILTRADELKERGRFLEALTELLKARSLAPDDPEVYLSFALTYDAMEDFHSSIANFRKSLRLDSADAYVWTQLGITLGRMSRYHEALEVFQKALGIDPGYTFARWNAALVHRSLGCYEFALDEFRSCIETEPDSDYIKGEIHYQLGLCYFDMGWTVEALRELALHVSLYPDDPWANLAIGNCYLDCGWIEESIRKYRELIESHQDFVPAYNSLALSLAEKGWYDEALEVLRNALAIAPDDKSIKDSMDYIQSLSDDEYGFKAIVLTALLHVLRSRTTGTDGLS